MNRPILTLFAAASLATLGLCQEKYWVAGSSGAIQLDSTCFPHQTVAPTGGRDFAVAPDGKVWIPNSNITVLNPDGTHFLTITPSLTAYSIAFDRAGHAWVTGSGGGLEEFDAAGNSLQVLTLPTGSPRQICVDADDNKWIAHRVGPPGSLSRVDGVTGVITSHPLPVNSLILPIGICADSRGFVGSSHIWTVGDNRGAGEVVEFDATGNWLSTTVISAGARLQWMAADCDATGNTAGIWVGDWGNGNLHRVDTATLAVTTPNTFTAVAGVAFDGFGDLMITLRGNGGVLRVDPITGAVVANATIPASSAVSTRWQQATVVDRLGDLDGDGNVNIAEVMGGSSPFDPCSRPDGSLSTSGSMAIGATTTIDVQAAPGALTLVAFATAMAASPLTVPGIGCTADVDPATVLTSVALIGPSSLNLNVPNAPAFVGVRLLVQALNASVPRFTNVVPLWFF